MPTHLVSKYISALGPEDYEEAELIAQWCKAMNRLEEKSLSFASENKSSADPRVAISELTKKLGYDPLSGRPPRPRGRIRDKAIPKPLPDKGTELRSCLGDKYVILGYAAAPLSKGLTMAIYMDHHERTVVRTIAHLFCGSLNSNEAFVTWPTDPRGLKPDKPIPLTKRRAMSAKVLANDEHADPEAPGVWVKPRGRY